MDSEPIITLRVRTLLWLILILTIADFSLSLVNFGITSFFLGIVATGATLVHVITHLSIVFLHEKGYCDARRDNLPPTSKVYSIVMDALLTILFIAAFTITVLVQVTDYFGSLETGVVVYVDAAMEAVCAIALVVLGIFATLDRRRVLRMTQRI